MGRFISRRRFLTYAAGAAVGTGLYGVAWEPRRFHIADESVVIRGLPQALYGLKVVHLSDFHRGHWVSEDHIGRAGDLARTLDADLVVLTGDFVTGRASYAWSCLDALGSIPSRLGTFAVMGNHDWWTDSTVVRRALARAGVHVLSNAAVRITLDDSPLWLLGVEDMWSPAFSLAKAVYAAGSNEPRILLCHNPDVFATASAWGLDLVLSGHTHGGQVCLPGIGPLLLPIRADRRLASGTHRVGRTSIHVTRGVGVVAPPVRINCPPEVSRITLHPEADYPVA
ncbi:metallophosphoesterase [Candidatus Fermentibacteria bacterium]|nr:metallophosphoesterase [Candidatus Fermentibacteria bacterium]